MLAAALDSLEAGVEQHYWCKEEKDSVVIYHNMTHAKLNARVNAYFKSHPPCYDERKHFLELKESLCKNETIDWSSPVQRYLFDDLVARELCTYLTVEERGNPVLLTYYYIDW